MTEAMGSCYKDTETAVSNMLKESMDPIRREMEAITKESNGNKVAKTTIFESRDSRYELNSRLGITKEKEISESEDTTMNVIQTVSEKEYWKIINNTSIAYRNN